MNRKILIRLPILLAGAGLVFVSIFAFQLGLDNDPGWGGSRYVMLLLGLGLILFGCLYWITPSVSNWFQKRAGTPAFFSQPIQQQRAPSAILTGAGLTIALLVAAYLYVWILTFGTMDQWAKGKNYYGRLTQAFQHGQVYLLDEPNPALLQLENPYDHHQRKGLDYLWDTSLYEGKYYLYWGPVPAVMGWIWSTFTTRLTLDSGLVFLFVFGIALFLTLLLRRLHLDGWISRWGMWGGIAVAIFNVPSVWLLTRPTYYEVSIAGGQFFITAGFYLYYLAFRSPSPKKLWIFLSAWMFAFAGGTRINLLPFVVIMGAVMLFHAHVKNSGKVSDSIPAFAAISIPLILTAAGLAWYNYIRFDSALEFGHRYQLTGPSLTADYGDTISTGYVLPNLYTYVFRLPELSREFSFLRVPWIRQEMWPSFIHLPEHYYYTEPVAGILFIVPIVGLAACLLAVMMWRLLNGDISFTKKPLREWSIVSWLALALFGYVAIQMLILLVFINSAMRYLVDVTPALLLLVVLFAGFYVRAFISKKYQMQFMLFAWILLTAATVIFGFLIGFTGDKNLFLNNNPALFYQLLERFSF
jgi:hypothetical protein